MKTNIFLIGLLMVSIICQAKDSPIIIMPVGNSITAGEHYKVPALEERTGYRKTLFEMLIGAGYSVDFVGTQEHGKRSVTAPDWYDWNNEAYPGWKIPEISNKVKAALPVYNPDILLVHVGTNGGDWDNKPGQVKAMLNMVNDFSVKNNHPITVFLCKIINRFIDEDQTATTNFNNKVEEMVAARSGDSIKIIIVDMEKGAGLDYSDNPPDSTANPPYEGGDMWGRLYPGVSYDKYHPNDKGDDKMALKFYKEMISELPEPESVAGNDIDNLELTTNKEYHNILTWKANFVDEVGYIIERCDIGGIYCVVDSVDANVMHYVDSTLTPINKYTYRIKAFSETGETGYSPEVTYVPVVFNVTVTVEGKGTVSPGSGTYLKGNKVVFTAVPDSGWKFQKWSGDVNLVVNPYNLTVNADKTISAVFSEISSSVYKPKISKQVFYPNPVAGQLEINLQFKSMEEIAIELIDLYGRKIISRKGSGPKHSLFMGNINPGIYIIRVSNNDGETMVEQILKE